MGYKRLTWWTCRALASLSPCTMVPGPHHKAWQAWRGRGRSHGCLHRSAESPNPGTRDVDVKAVFGRVCRFASRQQNVLAELPSGRERCRESAVLLLAFFFFGARNTLPLAEADDTGLHPEVAFASLHHSCAFMGILGARQNYTLGQQGNGAKRRHANEGAATGQSGRLAQGERSKAIRWLTRCKRRRDSAVRMSHGTCWRGVCRQAWPKAWGVYRYCRSCDPRLTALLAMETLGQKGWPGGCAYKLLRWAC